jgi:hypothetical protein
MSGLSYWLNHLHAANSDPTSWKWGVPIDVPKSRLWLTESHRDHINGGFIYGAKEWGGHHGHFMGQFLPLLQPSLSNKMVERTGTQSMKIGHFKTKSWLNVKKKQLFVVFIA